MKHRRCQDRAISTALCAGLAISQLGIRFGEEVGDMDWSTLPNGSRPGPAATDGQSLSDRHGDRQRPETGYLPVQLTLDLEDLGVAGVTQASSIRRNRVQERLEVGGGPTHHPEDVGGGSLLVAQRGVFRL